MSFFSRLFSEEQEHVPDIAFGRSYERVKNTAQSERWDLSVKAYDEGKYIDSIEHFLLYLMEPETDTVRYSKNEKGITFTICQGSQLVRGEADDKWFRATVDIIKCEVPNIGLFRRLLESSYKLLYGRYALLENNNISIIFDGYVQEASPFKLLYGLKEIALRADMEDDLLSAEFSQAARIPSPYVKAIPDEEKKIKYKYFRKWLERALSAEPFGHLNKSKFPSAAVYVYLSTLFKIDYLIHPEGRIMEMIETAHRKYFSRENPDLNSKVASLEKVCRQLLDMSEEKFAEELYRVEHTFPITNQVTTQELAEHMEVELQVMIWYYENKHMGICRAICDFIVSNSFFNYTLPAVSHAMLHQYFLLTEPDFFRELGFKVRYEGAGKTEATARELEKACKKLIEANLGELQGLEQALKLDGSGEFELRVSLLRFVQNFHYRS